MAKNADTKTLIMEAAERLFAEQGVNAVALREISVAAGQKNASALQYHFGSRELLVEALISYRMAPINSVRLAMLKTVLESGEPVNARDIAKTLILPLAQRIFATGKGSCYAKFLAQFIGSADKFSVLENNEHFSSIRECTILYRQVMPDLSWALLNSRVRMVFTSVIQELANIEHEWANIAHLDPSDYVAQIGNLIDASSGLLGAGTELAQVPDVLSLDLLAGARGKPEA